MHAYCQMALSHAPVLGPFEFPFWSTQLFVDYALSVLSIAKCTVCLIGASD